MSSTEQPSCFKPKAIALAFKHDGCSVDDMILHFITKIAVTCGLSRSDHSGLQWNTMESEIIILCSSLGNGRQASIRVTKKKGKILVVYSENNVLGSRAICTMVFYLERVVFVCEEIDG